MIIRTKYSIGDKVRYVHNLNDKKSKIYEAVIAGVNTYSSWRAKDDKPSTSVLYVLATGSPGAIVNEINIIETIKKIYDNGEE